MADILAAATTANVRESSHSPAGAACIMLSMTVEPSTGRATGDARMKILWLSQNLPYPPKTGVLQRNYHLIRQASRFADIHLVAILKRDILPGYDAALAERRLRELCASVRVVELPAEKSRLHLGWLLLKSLFTEQPFTVNWAAADDLARAIADAAAQCRFDAAYFDTISLAPYRRHMASLPAILNHHNIESGLFDRRIAFERNPLKRFYLRQEARKLAAYEARVAREFDVHATVSALDAQRLADGCPGARATVVANGVDVEYFSPRSDEAENGHLVMVSGMNWFPNRDAAIFMAQEIWPLIRQAKPQCRLSIVGTSPPAEVLELAANDARVAVTGFAADVRPYIEAAQVYLCPMRDGGGTRLKILDALAMGRPIVATTMALEGIPVVPERDVLVADSPAEFVRQVSRIVEDPGLGRRIAASGRSFVEKHFAWPVIGAALESAFRTVAAARPARA